MRIIAGAFKGRTILSPTWTGLRPTSDRLRETLFDVLGPSIVGAAVLDVCAGTGAIGLEALSRGARHATFVDDDPRALRLIGENAARCGCANRCIILRGAVPRSLRGAVAGGPFDLVVLDPPYDASWIGEALAAAAGQLAPDGLVVLEHAARLTPPTAAALTPVRTRRAGDSALSTYRRAADGLEDRGRP